MAFLVSLFVLISLSTPKSSAHNIYYVMPEDSSPHDCPNVPCLTLDQYAENPTYFTTGSTFIFLVGNHTVQRTVRLTEVSNVTFTGEVSDFDASIVGKKKVTIVCNSVRNIIIENLTFYGIKPSVVLRVNNSGLILISHVTFQGSESTAAIFATNSTLNITSSIFDSYNGGTIYAMNGSNVAITGTLFSKNTVNSSGGAIYLHHSSLTLNGTLKNKFVHNSALFNGGAIYCDQCIIKMTGCNIFQNNSAQWGTIGMYTGELTISGTAEFSSNRANLGGVLYLQNSTASLGGQEINFTNNSAHLGGAIFSRNSTVKTSTDYLHWTNNSANDSGGAIFADTSSLTLGSNLNHYHYFSYNSAGVHNGGAIACQFSNITIHGTSNFSENHALGDGAAISIDKGNIALLGYALFSNNWAEEGGGACFLQHSYALFTGKGIQFMTNTADRGGGIYSIFSQLLVDTKNLNFFNNTAHYGGAVMIVASTGTNILSGMYFANMAKLGGAVYMQGVENATLYSINLTSNSRSAVCIIESNVSFKDQVLIHNNNGVQGGGVYSLYSFMSFSGNNTLISNNSGEQGGGVYSLNSFVVFNGVTNFVNNYATTGGAINSLYGRIVMQQQGSIEFLRNTAHSNGGAIYASGSQISINGTADFSFNMAQKGGAMFYETSATLTIHTNISFSHNLASDYGGAIYNEDVANLLQCTYKSPKGSRIDNNEVDRLPYCFMQIEGLKLINSREGILISINISLTGYNNSAQRGGNFLYGGLLNKCKMFAEAYRNGKIALVPYIVFQQGHDWLRIISEPQHNSWTKEITSQPYQLCFCDDCAHVIPVEVYRGQKFSVHLIAMDQLQFMISSQVIARTSPTARLKLNQSIQTIHNRCTPLTYNLYSSRNLEQVILYTEGPCHYMGLGSAVINITLLPCPSGFKQYNELCDCEERLQEYHTNCTINEGIIITKKAVSQFWMSGLYVNETYQGLVLCRTCPVEYCIKDTIDISLDDPDLQCDLNRSKLLCGACATINGQRLSLMLGSLQCGECSSTYLALLLPFAAAGVALVVFLSALRLTVASGKINSVIFYANIIQANRHFFFQTDTVNILTVFIAWMNLDLGFKTCFYNGMTAYAQTWLQFAFPVYVWILISLIILISRYSITVSKLVGHNPVSVLATLLLMSYNKILKSIIDVFTFDRLEYPDNKTVPVWLKDANVPYLQSWHLFLTVVTSLVLVFLFLPYTLLLLLGHKLHRFSNRKYFRWFNRFKPILDSYYAPYKSHTRYWTGFLLLVRCTLYIVFTFNSLRSTRSALILTLTAIVTKAWLFGRIYEKLYLDIIESSIYVNLIVLSILTDAEIYPSAIAYSLIGIVFFTTIGIIAFQFLFLYTANLFFRLGRAFLTIASHFKTQNENEPPNDNRPMNTASFVDLRESLLESVVH